MISAKVNKSAFLKRIADTHKTLVEGKPDGKFVWRVQLASGGAFRSPVLEFGDDYIVVRDNIGNEMIVPQWGIVNMSVVQEDL